MLFRQPLFGSSCGLKRDSHLLRHDIVTVSSLTTNVTLPEPGFARLTASCNKDASRAKSPRADVIDHVNGGNVTDGGRGVQLYPLQTQLMGHEQRPSAVATTITHPCRHPIGAPIRSSYWHVTPNFRLFVYMPS
ncbi:hypothetical protein VTK56DRAFT_9423 [Thermocarpiscus australiensis]